VQPHRVALGRDPVELGVKLAGVADLLQVRPHVLDVPEQRLYQAWPVGVPGRPRCASPSPGCSPASPTCWASSSCPRLNFRAALPSHGLQALHAEGGPVTDPAAFQVCNSTWLLDDFTADNGAIRVVPGSHLTGRSPSDVMADRRGSRPGEVLQLAPARTVVVFNSHLWHGAT